MELSHLKKIAWIVNIAIFLMVFGHMIFFWYIDVPFLVAFSIPDACVYIIGFVLIHYDKLNIYVWLVYCWITLYTCVTTICIGIGYGFHLYCFSIVPIIFVTEYIAYKQKRRSMKALPVSLIITAFYIIFTSYGSSHGPVFERSGKQTAFFWSLNALVVFSFLIAFISYLIRLIIISEEKLKKAAQTDPLTQLYNRHYMFERLKIITNEDKQCILAMTDIDDFKQINDTYGHNAGDEVLKHLSELARKECSDCEISRWGGEEFLIISYAPYQETVAMFEELRKKVEVSPVSYDGKKINVTITVGIASRYSGQDPDKWIQIADNRMYYGKNNGKNRIVVNNDKLNYKQFVD